jgi:hypothetical protein
MSKCLLILLMLSSTALAGTWGQTTTITGYFLYDNGSAYIRVAHMQNPNGCASGNYLFVDANAVRFKEMWAQILTAHASGSTVSIAYEGCSPGGDYPKVMAIAVPSIW